MPKFLLKINIQLTCLTIFILLFSLFPAQAAELIFDSPEKASLQQEKLVIPVYLNGQGENLNALEGVLSYPQELIKLVQIQDGGSIISFWIEPPRETNGEIKFSGIIPGGYDGSTGLLFKLIFQPQQTGSGDFGWLAGRALINDGQGTAAHLTFKSPRLTIGSEPVADRENNAPLIIGLDNIPPDNFQPLIMELPEIAPGQLFLIFAAQDKQSGLDYYEIQEGNRKYVRATSPYLLRNQKRDVEIKIRAVDRQGNVREVSLPPLSEALARKNYINKLFSDIIITAVSLIVLGWFGRFIWKRKKHLHGKR